MPRPPLATPSDVENVWRPLTGDEISQIEYLISVASTKLRHDCPFDIDSRVALYEATPASDPMPAIALDPLLVANVVATIVKRFLDNREGAVSATESIGGYSKSASFVNRYDKTGSDVRGAIQVIAGDIAQLRPPTRIRVPGMIQLRPTRAMNPASQWTVGRLAYDSTDSYNPSYDPDPTDDVTPETTTTTADAATTGPEGLQTVNPVTTT